MTTELHMADGPPAGARAPFKKWLIRIVLGLLVVSLCAVLAFYGYFGYQAHLQKRHDASEAAALKALFARDGGTYLYVKARTATLRKAPSPDAAAIDELGIGALVYNGAGSTAQTRNGYIAVNSAPAGGEAGWIRIDEIAAEFPDMAPLLAAMAAEQDPDAKLDLADTIARLEPGNPAAWRPLLSLARQRKDAALIASASEGLRTSEEPVFLVVHGSTWGTIEGAALPGKRPEVGTRLATPGPRPLRYRFQGGNECHIQALTPGRRNVGLGVDIASNRPKWARPIALKRLGPDAAASYRTALEGVLAQRDDVPETIRDELLGSLLGALYRVPGTPFVLVTGVVQVPSEGDQAYFRANLVLDTTAPSPQFVSILTDWTRYDDGPADAFLIGEKKPALTFVLRGTDEGVDPYAFYQFDAAKDTWTVAFEAHVPGC